MGGSSKSQEVGAEYRMHFVSAIGCPVEDVLAFKFDDKEPIYGNRTPLMIDDQQYGVNIYINKKTLYGQDEGGVQGDIRCYYGTGLQPADPKYAQYMQDNGKPVVAYQGFLSYCYLDNFYIGNTKQPREMKALIKRVNTRIDRDVAKWYPEAAEISGNPGEYIRGRSKFDAVRLGGFGHSIDQIFSVTRTGRTGFAHQSGQLTFKLDFTVTSATDCDVTLQILLNSASRFIRVTSLSSGISLISRDDTGADYWDHNTNFLFKIAAGINQQHYITLTADFDNVGVGLDYESEIYFQMGLISATSGVIGADDRTDLNPIHEIYEIYTDDTALNNSVVSINDANFRRAADYIYNEGLGISYHVQDMNCKDLIDDLSAHIHAAVRKNRQTGQLEMVLFRDDWFDLDEVMHFTKSQIKNFKADPVGGSVDNINTYNVTYNDRAQDKTLGFPVYNNAARMNAGGKEVAEDLKYPYFSNERNANLSAQRQLKLSTTPKWEGSFETPVYAARKLNRYDVIKISPGKSNIVALPVRILSIGLGDGIDSNLVSIQFEEVISFSKDNYPSVVIEQPIVVDRAPVQSEFIVFEATYLDFVQMLGQQQADSNIAYAPSAGYLGVVAIQANASAINGILYTNDADEYAEVGNVEWCPHCVLDQNIDRVMTSFSVKNPHRLDELSVGHQIRIGSEIMVFMSFNEVTNILTVKRGASPTIPKPHLKDAVFYCADNFETFDLTAYQNGEIVEAKVLTVASDVQDFASADVKSIEIVGLVNRPHPPANVEINNTLWPETLLVASDLIVTWVHRNRLQQTGGVPLGFYEGGIAVESGVTYTLELSTVQDGVVLSEENIDANTFTIQQATIIPNKAHKLKLWAVRDGYESIAYEHNFFAESASLILTATATASQVSGNTVPTANITVDVDASLKANIQFDGSKITGKAPAGATITIDIED